MCFDVNLFTHFCILCSISWPASSQCISPYGHSSHHCARSVGLFPKLYSCKLPEEGQAAGEIRNEGGSRGLVWARKRGRYKVGKGMEIAGSGRDSREIQGGSD